jgi:hypothetical protein
VVIPEGLDPNLGCPAFVWWGPEDLLRGVVPELLVRAFRVEKVSVEVAEINHQDQESGEKSDGAESKTEVFGGNGLSWTLRASGLATAGLAKAAVGG